VLPDAGEQVIVVGPLRSAAVAAKVTVAPAVLVAFVMTFGGIVSVGGVVSTTLTTKEALAVFPAASVAVHSTVVAPIGKNEPEGVLHETLTACPSSSTAVGGEYWTVAPPGLVNSAVTSGAAAIVGGVVSSGLTVTRKLPEAALPKMSVVVHVTVVVPIGNLVPLGAEHPTPPRFRKAVPNTLNDTAAPSELVAFTVMSSGKRTVGWSTGVTTSWIGTGPVETMAFLSVVPCARVTLNAGISGVYMPSAPILGGICENKLSRMITPTAPAFWALSTLRAKSHPPRSISTMFPAILSPLNGVHPSSTTISVAEEAPAGVRTSCAWSA
jgi:hypothetical protein